jgi:hypothetical protein
MSDNHQPATEANTQEQIRVAAYYKWLQAGKPAGNDLDFWRDAEREHMAAQSGTVVPSTDGEAPHREVVVRPKARAASTTITAPKKVP